MLTSVQLKAGKADARSTSLDSLQPPAYHINITNHPRQTAQRIFPPPHSPYTTTPPSSQLQNARTARMAAMFSQNPLMNGPNYSFNDAPKTNNGEFRQHRFDP